MKNETAPTSAARQAAQRLAELRRDAENQLRPAAVKFAQAQKSKADADRRQREATELLAAAEREHAGLESSFRYRLEAASAALMDARSPLITETIKAYQRRITEAQNAAGLADIQFFGRRRLASTNVYVIREFVAAVDAAIAVLNSEEVAVLDGPALETRFAEIEEGLPEYKRRADTILWSLPDRGTTTLCAVRIGDGMTGFPVRYVVDEEIVSRAQKSTFEEADAWAAVICNRFKAELEERSDEAKRRNMRENAKEAAGAQSNATYFG